MERPHPPMARCRPPDTRSLRFRHKLPPCYVQICQPAADLQEWVFAARRPIHVVGRVDRLLALRIGDSQELAVGIVPELGDAIDGVGQLRNAIQRVGSIDRLLPQRIDHAAESPCGIERPFCFAIERIFHRNQIAQFIGKRRRIVQGILDRERLTLGIDRDDRGLVQRIGDRSEVAFRIVAKVVVWFRGSVTVAGSTAISFPRS